MTWLVWRQHRISWALALALVAAFAVPVWITGGHLRDAANSCTLGCNGGSIFHPYNAMNIVVDLTVLVPAIIGIFWGAATVGKESEFGTTALVWTQSISRRRWIAGKLAALLIASLLVSGAVTGLVSWWSYAHNALLESRFGGLQFDIQGVVPIGYTVFAAALGFTAGIVWRRTLPAMATTLVGVVVARIAVEVYARPHYRAPVTSLSDMTKNQSIPQGALQLDSTVVLHGHVVSGPIRVPTDCVDTVSRDAMSACLGRLGYQLRTTYQPAGRYWTFQWIEFGIFAALAALLVAAGTMVLLRRDA